MTRLDTIGNLLRLAAAAHYEHVEIAQDEPLPLDLGIDWLDESAVEIDALLASPDVEARPAYGLATLAYDVSRTMHSHLCASRDPACRTDTKVVSDLVTMLARILMHAKLSHSVVTVGAQHLESPHLDRSEAIRGLEAALMAVLHSIEDDAGPVAGITTTPVVQLNTAVSRIGDDDYLALRTLTTQIHGAVNTGPFDCEITSDYATPATRDAFVSESRVRSRIYRVSAMVVFSRSAGDGSSIAWTIAEELNIPTLVLREPGDTSAAARFPGQLCTREVLTYKNGNEAVAMIGNFLTRNRSRVDARARLVYEYSTLSTDHLTERMNSLDLSAFDNSPVTWERARFFTGNPVHWFQAPSATSAEIKRVLGLGAGHPSTSRGGERNGVATANLPATSNTRRTLSVNSVRALLSAAETYDISFEDQDRLIAEWERPGVLITVSPLDRDPSFETWVSMFHRLTGP